MNTKGGGAWGVIPFSNYHCRTKMHTKGCVWGGGDPIKQLPPFTNIFQQKFRPCCVAIFKRSLQPPNMKEKGRLVQRTGKRGLNATLGKDEDEEKISPWSCTQSFEIKLIFKFVFVLKWSSVNINLSYFFLILWTKFSFAVSNNLKISNLNHFLAK